MERTVQHIVNTHGLRRGRVLWYLTALAIVAQLVPFLLWPVPEGTVAAAAQVPAGYPADYGPVTFAKARALDLAQFWGGWLHTLAAGLALLGLLSTRISEWLAAVSTTKPRAWLGRLLFLIGVFLALKMIGLPFQYGCFVQNRAAGLTGLSSPQWLNLVWLGLTVPLVLFVLKYLVVICLLPLCKRSWWLVAALGLFLIGEVAPELVSRTIPLDSVEDLQPLQKGPHQEAVTGMLRKAGLNLPVLVVDQSHRSRSADLWLTGRAGREYVVITDTFLQQYTPRQVALALAHEIGHFQHKLTSMLIQKTCALLLLLLVFGVAFLLSGRQAPTVTAAPRMILLVLLSSLVISNAFSPVSLAVSRSEERFADRYAVRLARDGKEFGRLLLLSAQHELQLLDLPAWRYYFSASHPTPLERMGLAMNTPPR